MGQMQTEEREHIKLTNVNCPWKPFLHLTWRQQETHIFHPKPLPNMCHPRSLDADKTLQNLGDRSHLTSRNPRNLVRNKQTERPFCSVLPSIPAPSVVASGAQDKGRRRRHINAVAVVAFGQILHDSWSLGGPRLLLMTSAGYITT